jgi:hypothetical protein
MVFRQFRNICATGHKVTQAEKVPHKIENLDMHVAYWQSQPSKTAAISGHVTAKPYIILYIYIYILR